MTDTVDGFGKKRNHSQYGKEEKDPQEEDMHRELPKTPSNVPEKNKKKK